MRTIQINPGDHFTSDNPEVVGERWDRIPQFPRYWLSTEGRCWATKGDTARKTAKFIARPLNIDGYAIVNLWRSDGTKATPAVHDLMAKMFLGPKPEWAAEVRHFDDVKSNNAIANLAYGTCSDNRRDSVRNGTHHFVSREACRWGHLYTVANTAYRVTTGADGLESRARRCRACSNADTKLGSRKHPDFQAVSNAAFRQIEGLPPLTLITPVDPDLIRASLAPTREELNREYARSLDADLRAQSVA